MVAFVERARVGVRGAGTAVRLAQDGVGALGFFEGEETVLAVDLDERGERRSQPEDFGVVELSGEARGETIQVRAWLLWRAESAHVVIMLTQARREGRSKAESRRGGGVDGERAQAEGLDESGMKRGGTGSVLSCSTT